MSEHAAATKPYVFLSYTSRDRTRVLALADRLEAAGIRVWADRREIVGGSSWDTSIVDAIRDCTVFALTCSARSLGSPNVQQEVRLAWEEQRPILPLLLEPVVMPRELRYPLAGRQWVELLDRPEDAWLPDVLRALAGLGLLPTPPPSRPAAPPPAHLPTPLTSFLGREQELADVTALLASTRLLTLTGLGGTGKTRLAIESAHQVAPAFADSVWFVDLSGVTDPAGVIPAIAQVLNVRESEGRSLAVSLAAYLRSKRLLLVLDNFEQVVSAAPQVYDLLAEAPALAVLVTSRVLLRVGGEHAYPVPPLPLPEPNQARRETLAQNPAVRLFVERARALRPDFALAAENAAVIAAICTRLDGLPLAIELAAARVRLLPMPALLARLEQRFTLLVGGERNRPERQQTLRATIAWSWDLLTEEEQRLFRRLAVFAGGWTLAAAEAVCCPDGELDVLEGLASLVDQSLVRQREVNDEPRFTLLATLQEFALEQLAHGGETEALRHWHAEYYATLAEQADAAGWRSGRTLAADAFLLLDAERDNVLAALGWALVHQETALGLRLGGALGAWFYTRMPREGRRWAEQLLALPGAETPSQGRGGTLFSAGVCAFVQGEAPVAVAYMDEATALFRVLEDLPRLSRTLALIGLYSPREEAPRALALTAEALVRAWATGEPYTIAFAEHFAGLVQAWHGQDLRAARAHLEEALRQARSLGAEWLTMVALTNLAELAYAVGQHVEAGQGWREARPLAEALGERYSTAGIDISLALLAGTAGNLTEAAVVWRRALLLACDVGSTALQAVCLAGIGGLLTRATQPEPAVRLLAAATVAWGDQGHDELVRRPFQQAYEPALAAARAAVAPEAFAQPWAEGETLSLEQAAAAAVALLDDLVAASLAQPVAGAGPRSTATLPDGLSAREVQVLRLIAAGQSTRAIAAALVIAEGTVERHITNLYGKIGAQSRADATAYAFRNQLVPPSSA